MIKKRTPPVLTEAQKKKAAEEFAAGADMQPSEHDERPKAAKNYKSLTIHFNKYEFDRLTAACEKTGESKLNFIRTAIQAACDK